VQPTRRSLASGCDGGWQRQFYQQRRQSRSQLPRSLEETNSLWIRNAAPRPGRLRSADKANVERLRKELHSAKGEPIWRGIEVDFKAFAALIKAHPEDTVMIDPCEDKEAENTAVTKPFDFRRKTSLMIEGLQSMLSTCSKNKSPSFKLDAHRSSKSKVYFVMYKAIELELELK
jgi:hypothetical protein